jgi:hypothetical protein
MRARQLACSCLARSRSSQSAPRKPSCGGTSKVSDTVVKASDTVLLTQPCADRRARDDRKVFPPNRQLAQRLFRANEPGMGQRMGQPQAGARSASKSARQAHGVRTRKGAALRWGAAEYAPGQWRPAGVRVGLQGRGTVGRVLLRAWQSCAGLLPLTPSTLHIAKGERPTIHCCRPLRADLLCAVKFVDAKQYRRWQSGTCQRSRGQFDARVLGTQRHNPRSI